MKFVTIKRKPQSRIPTEIYDTSTQYVGGGYSADTNDVLRGITFEEEDLLLPSILGLSPTSNEWMTKVKNFHANIDIPVPAKEGKKLNISTTKRTIKNKEGKEVEYEFPVVPLDYIYYKHCLKHDEVAKSRETVDFHPKYRFYIEDAQELMDVSNQVLETKNKMRQHLLKMVGPAEKDHDLIRAILVVAKEFTGREPSTKEEENVIAIDKFAEAHPSEFVKFASDDTIKAKAFVHQLISYNLITSVGNQIYDDNVGTDPLADSIPDFIKYLVQPKNSAYKAGLAAKLAAKKGK